MAVRMAPVLVPPLAVWVPTSEPERGRDWLYTRGCCEASEQVVLPAAGMTVEVTLRASFPSSLQQACKTNSMEELQVYQILQCLHSRPAGVSLAGGDGCTGLRVPATSSSRSCSAHEGYCTSGRHIRIGELCCCPRAAANFSCPSRQPTCRRWSQLCSGLWRRRAGPHGGPHSCPRSQHALLGFLLGLEGLEPHQQGLAQGVGRQGGQLLRAKPCRGFGR